MKTLLIDMYGVILKESKGKFIPYTYEHIAYEEHEKVTKLFRQENIFSKAQLGFLTSNEFLETLGFHNPEMHMKDYIENYLTLDEEFKQFMETNGSHYNFILLSNDVLEWNQYIMEYHQIEQYFDKTMVSGAVGIRKPDIKIFEEVIKKYNIQVEDCIFIDNSVKNLKVADSLGINAILFNRDNVRYSGTIVNNFRELNLKLDEITSKISFRN